MQLPATMQGRPFGPEQLAQVQALLNERGPMGRTWLSRELARRWEWRTGTGQLKDMAARTLLLKMEARGWIRLPERRWKRSIRAGQPRVRGGAVMDESSVEGALEDLAPVRLQEVSQGGQPGERAQLEACLDRYHYLGYRSRVGQNLQYWVRDRWERPLGCVVFGAAAWQCAVRDQWIGWSADQRARQLSQVVNNTRFLIFSWVRVAHLASRILGLVSRQIGRDWQAKYRQPIWLLETFVDRQRFAGTCYQAANWIHLGQTKGRGRQGVRSPLLPTTIKEVYVWPLQRNFRHHLLVAPNHPSPQNLLIPL